MGCGCSGDANAQQEGPSQSREQEQRKQLLSGPAAGVVVTARKTRVMTRTHTHRDKDRARERPQPQPQGPVVVSGEEQRRRDRHRFRVKEDSVEERGQQREGDAAAAEVVVTLHPRMVQVMGRCGPTPRGTVSSLEVDGCRVGLKASSSFPPFQGLDLEGVFDDRASQVDVYEGFLKSTIGEFMSGVDALVMVYGKSGTGKSRTMRGDSDSLGMIDLAAMDIFDQLQGRRPPPKVVLRAFEVHKEELKDVLKEEGPRTVILKQSKRGLLLDGLTSHPVTDHMEVSQLVLRAYQNQGEKASHMFLQLTLELDGQVTSLFFVDLKGTQKIRNTGAGLNEGMSVNHALSSLVNVCDALASQRAPPYNNSLLTILLRRFFSREQLFNVQVLLHLSPLPEDYMDNKNILGFGATMMKLHIEGCATMKVGTRSGPQ